MPARGYKSESEPCSLVEVLPELAVGQAECDSCGAGPSEQSIQERENQRVLAEAACEFAAKYFVAASL